MQSKTARFCPLCDHEITASDINISEGFALCSGCGELSRLSDLNLSETTTEELLSETPQGVVVASTGSRMEVSISLYSLSKFLGALAVSLFWNGIVSVFVSLAAAAVYYNLFGTVPDWFPTPGLKDGKPIMNGQVMGWGTTLFFCAFLTPFVLIGSAMIVNALLRLFGSTVVVIDRRSSHVSTGIGFLRWKRRFDPLQVKSVDVDWSKLNQEGTKNHVIEISSTKDVRFGLLLSERQQNWMSAFLRTVLVHKRSVPKVRPLFWLN